MVRSVVSIQRTSGPRPPDMARRIDTFLAGVTHRIGGIWLMFVRPKNGLHDPDTRFEANRNKLGGAGTGSPPPECQSASLPTSLMISRRPPWSNPCAAPRPVVENIGRSRTKMLKANVQHRTFNVQLSTPQTFKVRSTILNVPYFSFRSTTPATLLSPLARCSRKNFEGPSPLRRFWSVWEKRRRAWERSPFSKASSAAS